MALVDHGSSEIALAVRVTFSSDRLSEGEGTHCRAGAMRIGLATAGPSARLAISLVVAVGSAWDLTSWHTSCGINVSRRLRGPSILPRPVEDVPSPADSLRGNVALIAQAVRTRSSRLLFLGRRSGVLWPAYFASSYARLLFSGNPCQ